LVVDGRIPDDDFSQHNFEARSFGIGGYTPVDKNIDALLFGYHDGDRLVHVSAHAKRLHAVIAGGE
jgi:hypothetical protein